MHVGLIGWEKGKPTSIGCYYPLYYLYSFPVISSLGTYRMRGEVLTCWDVLDKTSQNTNLIC